MGRQVKKTRYRKFALVISLCMILVWAMLGTGASLAWFTDTSEEVKNIFHFGEFDLEVSYRTDDGSYEKIDGQTKIFDEEALYEPGYVQVVFLKIENKGTVPFDFKTAVNVTDYTPATNVFGQTFNLQDYLEFGIVTAATETLLEEKVADREMAKEVADMPLNTYETDKAKLGPKNTDTDTVYMALVVRMPEEVDNEANYRGETVPKVELGIIVTAEQVR